MTDLPTHSLRGDVRRAMQSCAQFLHPSARHMLLLILAVTGSSTLLSQQFATLNLTVADPSGSVIGQANVSVRNLDTGAVRTGVSDKLGQTVIPGLPAGEYKLTADAAGFSAYEAPLMLRLGQTASVEVTLRVRAATEQVEVSDTTTGVDKQRTEDSQVIAPEQIAELPISDRDFIDFVLLTPTATVGRNSSSGCSVGVSGDGAGDQLRGIARDAQRLLWIGRRQLHDHGLGSSASQPIARLGAGVPRRRWSGCSRRRIEPGRGRKHHHQIRHQRLARFAL